MMKLTRRCAYIACLLFALPAALGSQRPAGVVRQEREQAARKIPQLAELLALKPGMIVAAPGALCACSVRANATTIASGASGPMVSGAWVSFAVAIR
jgi:hypothetical protein